MSLLDSLGNRLRPQPKPKLLPITPRLPFPWKQGEHLFLSGDTGSGKTTLANVLLYARDYTLSFRSKADPAPLPGLLVRRALDIGRDDDVKRYVLDPPHDKQLDEFWSATDIAWRDGGWTVYLDELFYLTGLKDRTRSFNKRVEMLLTQGRSNKLSIVCGVQRPAWVSVFAPSQATHLVAFRHSDLDLKRLQLVGNREWAETIASLKRYEFAWLYRPERQIWRGYVQQLLPKE